MAIQNNNSVFGPPSRSLYTQLGKKHAKQHLLQPLVVYSFFILQDGYPNVFLNLITGTIKQGNIHELAIYHKNVKSQEKRCIDIITVKKKKKYKTKVNMEPAAILDQRGLDLKDKTGIKHFPARAKSVLMQHSSQISLM